MQSSDVLLYPSISVCSLGNGSNNLAPYIVDGRLFQDKQSYLNFLDTNVSSSYDLLSNPNLTEIIHSIEVMDSNGTLHKMRPIKRDGLISSIIDGYYGLSIDPTGGPGLFVSYMKS